MNNYCTKCGKKIEEKDFFCKECGTPVVDLPVGYVYKSPEKKRKQKKIIIILASIFGFIIALVLLLFVSYTLKIGYLNENYVQKYMDENYPNEKYSIEYNGSGKCIVNVHSDTGCGVSYDYLSVTECRAYYYDVELSYDEITITVFKRNGKYSVIEGKNINGQDKLDME